MGRTIKDSAETYRVLLFSVLIFTTVVILISGSTSRVWGEAPDLPNLNTWVTNGGVNAIASEGGITYIGGGFTEVVLHMLARIRGAVPLSTKEQAWYRHLI